MCPVKKQGAMEHEISCHPAHRPSTMPIKISGCSRQDLINMRGKEGTTGYKNLYNE